MAKRAFIGISGVARKVKKIYVGVNGVARKVKKGYIGVGGVARQFYASGSRLFMHLLMYAYNYTYPIRMYDLNLVKVADLDFTHASNLYPSTFAVFSDSEMITSSSYRSGSTSYPGKSRMVVYDTETLAYRREAAEGVTGASVSDGNGNVWGGYRGTDSRAITKIDPYTYAAIGTTGVIDYSYYGIKCLITPESYLTPHQDSDDGASNQQFKERNIWTYAEIKKINLDRYTYLQQCFGGINGYWYITFYQSSKIWGLKTLDYNTGATVATSQISDVLGTTTTLALA